MSANNRSGLERNATASMASSVAGSVEVENFFARSLNSCGRSSIKSVLILGVSTSSGIARGGAFCPCGQAGDGPKSAIARHPQKHERSFIGLFLHSREDRDLPVSALPTARCHPD